MIKHDQTDFAMNWYELWANQTKSFFESANQQLGSMFAQSNKANPQDNMQQIKEWFDMLQRQWTEKSEEHGSKDHENYWKMMIDLCNEAYDVMLLQWIRRYREGRPVQSVEELYELWLDACHEIYQKSIRSKSYQDAYGDFMKLSMKYWQPSGK